MGKDNNRGHNASDHGFVSTPPIKPTPPTAFENPIKKESIPTSSKDVLNSVSYAKQHEKLKLKTDPKKVTSVEDLASYLVSDMSWFPKSEVDEDWIWGSHDKILVQLEQWAKVPAFGFGEQSFQEYSSPDEAFRYEENSYLSTTPKLTRALCRLGYEHYLAQPLPVFVFGTLRPGQGNFGIFKEYGAIESINETSMKGVAMVVGENYHYPRSLEMDKIPGVEDASLYSMAGDVISLKANHNGLLTRRDMDRLEGFRSNTPYNSMYLRVARKVEINKPDVAKEEILAWIYVTQNSQQIEPKNILKNGDWFNIENSNFRPERRKSSLLPENWTFPKEWGEEDEAKLNIELAREKEIAKEIEEYGEPLSNFK